MTATFRATALSLTALALAATAFTAYAQEPIVLRTGAFAPPGSVYVPAWQKFKENIEQGTRGAIKVELNTNDPNEGNLMSNMRRGRIECVGASLQGTSTILPEVAVLQLPYLFNSFAQVDRAYDQGLTEVYRKLFAAKGVALLQFVEVGFTHMYGVQPIKSPADVKGVKLRATQSRASQAFVKSTGAEPVVLAIAEAMPGLQTGLIKGGESGAIVYEALISKSAPHYTLTSHAFDSGTILCNKEWLDKLKPEQRTVVLNAYPARELALAARAQTEKFLREAASRGVTVYRPTPDEQKAWQAAGKQAADQLISGLGPQGVKIRDDIVKSIAGAK